MRRSESSVCLVVYNTLVTCCRSTEEANSTLGYLRFRGGEKTFIHSISRLQKYQEIFTYDFEGDG